MQRHAAATECTLYVTLASILLQLALNSAHGLMVEDVCAHPDAMKNIIIRHHQVDATGSILYKNAIKVGKNNSKTRGAQLLQGIRG